MLFLVFVFHFFVLIFLFFAFFFAILRKVAISVRCVKSFTNPPFLQCIFFLFGTNEILKCWHNRFYSQTKMCMCVCVHSFCFFLNFFVGFLWHSKLHGCNCQRKKANQNKKKNKTTKRQNV